MLKTIGISLALAVAVTAPLSAQGRGTKAGKVPLGQRPPAGMCRIWLNGVPPGQQPAPTDCATAVRNRPANGRVIFGDDYANNNDRGKGKKAKGRGGRDDRNQASRDDRDDDNRAERRRDDNDNRADRRDHDDNENNDNNNDNRADRRDDRRGTRNDSGRVWGRTGTTSTDSTRIWHPRNPTDRDTSKGKRKP